MIIEYPRLRKSVWFACFGLLFCFLGHSQINKADIIRKYHQIDTSLSNKDAYFLLFKNNTFINYGIYSNKEEGEWYIWYSTGTCQSEGGKLVCHSNSSINNQNLLIKDIKNSYKKRPDHLLIESDCEFVNEKAKDATFIMQGGSIVDQKKGLIYFEEK